MNLLYGFASRYTAQTIKLESAALDVTGISVD